MKVALLLGWFNIDDMLATGKPGQLDEWIKYLELEPHGDDWERTSLQTSQIINAIMAIAAGFGSGKSEPLEADCFVPYRKRSKRRSSHVSPAEWVATFKLGVGC